MIHYFLCCIPLVFAFLQSFGSEFTFSDTTRTIDVSGKLLIANGGFAPIPAFSFDSPIFIAGLTLRKHRFSYEPDMAVGLNGRPWMANNWFRYEMLVTRQLKLRGGINPFLFYYDELKDTGYDNIHIQRNLTVEVFSEINIDAKSSIQLAYRHNNGWDGALTGHFISIELIHEISFVKNLKIELKPNIFYFNFSGKLDGFFGAASVRLKHEKFPLSLYCQGVGPFWAGFPGTSFKVFSGVIYEF